MSIQAVTFPGARNFTSNLYALEVRSRFIDQSKANGYYVGYGDELKAIKSSNQITVGSGAFIIQGRMIEIDAGGETVNVEITNQHYGYICAKIETCPTSDLANCTLVVKTGEALSEISLMQDDTYKRESETVNKIYELPLYSFYMVGDAIYDLEKVIQPINEIERIYKMAKEAKEALENAQALFYTHHLNVSFKKRQTDGNEIWHHLYCDINSKTKDAVKDAESFWGLIETVKTHSCTGIVTSHPQRDVCMIYAVEERNASTITVKSKAYLSDEGIWSNEKDVLSIDTFYTVTDTVT